MDFVALGSHFVGSIWSSFHFTASSVNEIHFSHVPSSTLMVHQCIVAPLLQESLSFDSDMGLYLHFGSPYDDMQDLATILNLQHLLLHCLYFAHINKPLGNHYFVTVCLCFSCIDFDVLLQHQRVFNRGFRTLLNLQVFLQSA